MHPLRVRSPGQRVRVEGEHQSRHDAGEHVAGPGFDEQGSHERRQRESRQEDDVEDEHGGSAHPRQRRAYQGGDNQWLGKGQGIVRGIEDVGLEELCRMAGELVLDPGHDPLVQLSVAVVVAGVTAGSKDEGPRMQHCE